MKKKTNLKQERKEDTRSTKCNEKDSELIKQHLKQYITDTTNKGMLPEKAKVQKFLGNSHILEGHENNVNLVKTKVFNDKRKYRNGNISKI